MEEADRARVGCAIVLGLTLRSYLQSMVHMTSYIVKERYTELSSSVLVYGTEKTTMKAEKLQSLEKMR